MAKRRGGGLFTDDLTGNMTIFSKVFSSIFLIAALVGFGFLVYFLIKTFAPKKHDDKPEEGGGNVSPFDKIPGPLKIAEVAQAPSAGQAIIYFSQAAGSVCDTCTALFDINITYSGGQPTPPFTTKQVTASSNSGVVTFDYSVSGSGFSPVTPGHSTPNLPTSVQLDITARSVSSHDPSKKSGPTSFSKTIPYVG